MKNVWPAAAISGRIFFHAHADDQAPCANTIVATRFPPALSVSAGAPAARALSSARYRPLQAAETFGPTEASYSKIQSRDSGGGGGTLRLLSNWRRACNWTPLARAMRSPS